MSYTEIYSINRRGSVNFHDEIKNSHIGAMYVWDNMERKYLPPYLPEWFTPTISSPTASRLTFAHNYEEGKEVWRIVDLPNISLTDKIVMLSTYDNVYVQCKNIPQLVEAYIQYGQEHPNSSIGQQGLIIKEMLDDKKIWGVCWNQTSVNGDTYWADDERSKYNIFREEGKHWEIFNDYINAK